MLRRGARRRSVCPLVAVRSSDRAPARSISSSRLGSPVSVSWSAAWARSRTSVCASSSSRALSSAIDASWANRDQHADLALAEPAGAVAGRQPDHARPPSLARAERDADHAAEAVGEVVRPVRVRLVVLDDERLAGVDHAASRRPRPCGSR